MYPVISNKANTEKNVRKQMDDTDKRNYNDISIYGRKKAQEERGHVADRHERRAEKRITFLNFLNSKSLLLKLSWYMLKS